MSSPSSGRRRNGTLVPGLRRRRRRRSSTVTTGFTVALIGVLALAGLVAMGGSGDGNTPSGRARSRPAPPVTTPAPGTPHPAGVPAVASIPAGGRAQLAQAMHHWLGEAGPHTGALIYDLSRGRTLFAHADGVGRPPASVEKLYTTFALLKDLGAGARLHTEVLGAGHLAAHGVWVGDLYLRGGGDPTFGSVAFNRVWSAGEGSSVEALVDQLLHHGIRRVTGRVIADASLFDSLRGGPQTGYHPDILDMGGQLSALTYNHGSTVALTPEAFAAQQLAIGLRRAHVAAAAAPAGAPAPPSAHLLASVSSPSIATLVRLMDVPSDDLYAELLTKQLGARFARDGSITAGAHVISETVAGGLGIHPTIVDGSGLSRRDSSSPDQIVRLLTSVWHSATGEILKGALPVVGETGTVRFIGNGTPAAGRCVAKTGTLDLVTNLAGYCETLSGERLAFAVLLDGPPNSRSYVLLGKILGDMVSLDPGKP